MPDDDLHYALLRQLAEEPAASQRSLATRMGVSVGKVNYCIRALIDKGWLKANNFRRSDNKWAYLYLLTPSGMAAKVRMTKEFLARKELEYLLLRREIDELKTELVTRQEADEPTAASSPPMRAHPGSSAPPRTD